MRLNKKKNIIIAVLCGFLMFMGIGYALLAQTLTINATASVSGSFDVQITNIEATTVHGYAEDTSDDATKIANDGHSATISANLGAPGDYIVYTVTVSNLGTIAAMYDMATQNLVTSPSGQSTDIIEATTDVDKTDSLKYLAPTTGVGTFTVTLTFKESVETIPTDKNYQFTISPNFVQTTLQNGGGNGTGNEEGTFTPEPEFVILNDGTLFKYNINYGTNMVVPSTVTNIYSELSLNYNCLIVVDADNEVFDAIVYAQNKEQFDTIKDILKGSEYSTLIRNIYDASYTDFNKDSLGGMLMVDINLNSISFVDGSEDRVGITSVDFTNATSLTKINGQSFREVSTLTNVNLGNTLTTIEGSVFSNTNISQITIPASLTSISGGVFYNTPLFNTSTPSVTILGDSTRFDSNWSNIFGNAQKITN